MMHATLNPADLFLWFIAPLCIGLKPPLLHHWWKTALLGAPWWDEWDPLTQGSFFRKSLDSRHAGMLLS
jgi:hypothetical protein